MLGVSLGAEEKKAWSARLDPTRRTHPKLRHASAVVRPEVSSAHVDTSSQFLPQVVSAVMSRHEVTVKSCPGDSTEFDSRREAATAVERSSMRWKAGAMSTNTRGRYLR